MPYPIVRDRFLASSNTGDYAVWLSEVGRYVHHCWLAEERLRTPGVALDEDATKHLWDDCSQRELIALRTDAGAQLKVHRRTKLIRTIGAVLLSATRRGPGAIAVWILRTMVEGFVAGIGLILLGLLLAWLAPMVVKDIRGAVDDVLAQATSPHHAPEPAAAS